ncbi:MAG: hypothetical protein R8M45_09715 [Ghiorsea sp.]
MAFKIPTHTGSETGAVILEDLKSDFLQTEQLSAIVDGLITDGGVSGIAVGGSSSTLVTNMSFGSNALVNFLIIIKRAGVQLRVERVASHSVSVISFADGATVAAGDTFIVTPATDSSSQIPRTQMPGGLARTSTMLPFDYPLQTWSDALENGEYIIFNTTAQNGLPIGQWYLTVQRYSGDTSVNQQRVLTCVDLNGANAGEVYRATDIGAVWSSFIRLASPADVAALTADSVQTRLGADFATTSLTAVATPLTATITTVRANQPVNISISACASNSLATARALFDVIQGANQVGSTIGTHTPSQTGAVVLASGSVVFVAPTAGAYTFSLKAFTNSGTLTVHGTAQLNTTMLLTTI